jgi:glycerol-3-phosphate dehydrogenase (NAD(P)+)
MDLTETGIDAFDRDVARPNNARPFEHVTIIGAGAWGTALGITAARAGRQVRLWARSGTVANDINLHRRNSRYLAELDLPETLVATTDMRVATASAEVVLLVTPSTTVRDMSATLNEILRPDVPVIVCAKGIEDKTGLLMSDVARSELPGREIGVLSGPTFADETAKGFPTAVTVASEFDTDSGRAFEDMLSSRVAVSLSTEAFRAFISDDVIGVEVGGAVKNVLAIMCGISWGCGFASNTRAALITRGLDEMKVLAVALGGRRETVTGLSGIGDLMLTCSSIQSRNMRFGVQLGQRVPREKMFNGKPVVVEGVANAESVTNLARRLGVEMPICEAVRAIVHDGADIGETFGAHWGRPLEAEPRSLDFELPHPGGEDVAEKVAELMRSAILMH